MGFFRFRRSIKIAPGVRWNFGKRSTSVSLGPRGFKVTAGTRGVRTTVGIPGTGLSYTETSHPGSSSARPAPTTPTASAPPPATSMGTVILLAVLLGAVALMWRACA